ncbi:hypothetical protein OCH239_09295 [Roseivivax halodurans JCM 10272]|uniref:Uncharacterized protein n=1 Tax=Roseivivax halodurans JCM 10272 TaxID=1449350 RepID=X7EEK8_9RHOB|nr:hypothetical protein [Roseivivax halodurans]ETX13651.1 hypothetical protein OCH239_09295 [Roseivivax halodurans JCM 10272]
MSETVEHGVRAAILAQVKELQTVFGHLGIARAADCYMTEDGKAGLQGAVFHGHDDEVMDVGDRPFGRALSGIYLGRGGDMIVHDFDGQATLFEATAQVMENLTEFVYEAAGFEIVNRIDVVIEAAGRPGIVVDARAAGEEKQINWTFDETATEWPGRP